MTQDYVWFLESGMFAQGYKQLDLQEWSGGKQRVWDQKFKI